MKALRSFVALTMTFYRTYICTEIAAFFSSAGG
jgi:hypothetical protein